MNKENDKIAETLAMLSIAPPHSRKLLAVCVFAGCLFCTNQVYAQDYTADTTLNKGKITENSSVAKDIELTFTGTSSVSSSVTLTNNGIINIGTTGSSSTTTNSGTISGGIINIINGKFANKYETIANEIYVSSKGALDNSSASISVGKLIVEAGRKVTDSTGIMTITGTGSVNEGSIKQAQFSIVDKGSFENNDTLEVYNTFDNNGNLNGSGSLKLGDKTNVVNASNKGTISQSSINFANGNFTNLGSIETSEEFKIGSSGNSVLDNSANINAGKFTVQSVGKVTGDGNLTMGDGSSNSGQITQKMITSTGTFTNKGSVTVDNLNAQTIKNDSSAYSIVVNKDASIDTLTNSGTVDVKGILSSTNKITNKGIINTVDLSAQNIDNSKTVSVSGDAAVETLTNSGSFEAAGKLSSGTKITNKGSLGVNILSAKDVTNDGNIAVKQNAVVDNLTNNVTIDITGTLSSSEKITNNGSLTTESLSAKNLINEDVITIKQNAVINSLTNNGTIDIGNRASASNLTVTGNITGNNGVLNLTNTTFEQAGIVENQFITASDRSVLNIASPYNFNNNSLALNNSTLNLGSINLNPVYFNDLSMANGTINIPLVDVDLKNRTMGRIIADNYGDISGGVNVKDLNIQNYYNIPDRNEIRVLFTDNADFAHSVNYTGKDYLLTPIWKYGVRYEDTGSVGNFVFTPGAGASTSDAAAFNPAVLPSSVAAQSGSYAAMTETLNYSFRHADYTFMPYPSAMRKAMTSANRYAISEGQSMPYLSNSLQSKGIWFQPYASFENMHLKHGPRVDVNSYGSLVGGDGEYKELRNGWGTVTTAFVGYNGSNIHYGGVHTYQNGGVLGATQTFYKNNFFTALTVSAGASVGEANTMYGHENFTSLMAGVASKTGYNFEFKEGRFIIQPSWMMAYSFINTFDYTNAAGVRIDSDPLHSIQLHPTVKFIGNIRGWQPYASVGMVWNILNDTKVSANDIRLPEMSIKPYIEYGVGLQKSWKDKFYGFAQAMLRNGGRNGIALTLGFRWSLGNECKSIDKVQTPEQRKIVKQLSSAQKVALGKQLNTSKMVKY